MGFSQGQCPRVSNEIEMESCLLLSQSMTWILTDSLLMLYVERMIEMESCVSLSLLISLILTDSL